MRNAFRPGIDQQRKTVRILDPGRQQPPAHRHQFAAFIALANHHDRLRRRDIIARRNQPLVKVEKVEQPQFVHLGNQGVSSTHDLWVALRRGKGEGHARDGKTAAEQDARRQRHRAQA